MEALIGIFRSRAAADQAATWEQPSARRHGTGWSGRGGISAASWADDRRRAGCCRHAGRRGAAVGAEIGEETERTLGTGIPRDDLPLYRRLLTEGRSLVLAFVDSEEMEKAARLVMQNNGSEDVDEARRRFEKAA